MNEKGIADLLEQLAEQKKRGVDHGEVYLQTGTGHLIHYEDRRIEEISSFRADGVSARLVQGEATFMAHAPGLQADTASRVLRLAEADAGQALSAPLGGTDPLLEPEPGLPSLEADWLAEVDRTIREGSPWVKQVGIQIRSSSKQVLVLGSHGRAAQDRRRYTSFSVHVVVERDGILRTGYETRSCSFPVEQFWGGEDPLALGREALRRALLQLEARPCPAGVFPVVVSGSAGGTLIHEACGHGLEADIVRKDYSAFRDRLGQPVASPLIHLVDDATLPGNYGSYAVDDEGTPAGRTVLLEAGILKGYLTDLTNARLGGWPATGNGRRESYRCAPVPRMSNTFVLPGDMEEEEMLDRMGEGLYVRMMGGGEVDPTTGDFVFHVSEGYRVEGGVIAYPVRGATLTGNGPEVLRNVQAVGRDLHFEPGICGKAGQGVPVSDGQPSLWIREILVGGSDTGDEDA